MPELREVFDMATKHIEPDIDGWNDQERRQRRAARNRRIGALSVAAVIVIGLIATVFVVHSSDRSSVGGTHRSNGPSHAPSVAPPRPGTNPQDRVVVGLDGTTQQTLSGLPGDAYGLSLSGDGRTIAFVTAPGSIDEVATIGIDGLGLRILGPGSEPAISPDGTEVAFVRDGDIYAMATDGSNVRQLTTDPNGDEFPQWSPDGSTVVYDNLGSAVPSGSGYSDTSVIMTVPAVGGTPTQISKGRTQDSEPSYSPDGSQLVFRSHAAIWIMNADGSGAHHIVPNSEGTVDEPRWSPDGTKIAFTDYTAAWRASLDLGSDVAGSWPIELVKVIDLPTGKVTSVGHLAMATFGNAPQWLPSSDALLLNVVRKS